MEIIRDMLDKETPQININGRVCHHRTRILYALTELYHLENYIEIGVHNGSSMSYVLQSDKNRKCVGIDPFETLNVSNGFFSVYINKDKITENKSLLNINANNKHNSAIKLVKKLSNDVTDDDLDGEEFDLLFIDGNHDYDFVMQDFTQFLKYVKKGGFIVFDDLHQAGPGKAFREISESDQRVELFGSTGTEGILTKVV